MVLIGRPAVVNWRHGSKINMFEVKESPLHGRGLFATEFIPQDTVIGWLKIEPAPEDELDGPYVLWIDGDTPVRVTCDMRFINHSGEPNAAYYDDLSVMAVCDIQPGDELLHDYTGDGDPDLYAVDFEDDTEVLDVVEPAEELISV
ncbi:MAG: SET domain-containing protein [Planctomycetota bacterium]